MAGGQGGAHHRRVVLVGAGQAHLGVLRLWGLRRQREAAAAAKGLAAGGAAAAAAPVGDRTATALLRSLLGREAAGIPSEDAEGSARYSIDCNSVSLLLVTETTEVLYSGMLAGYIAGECALNELEVDLAPLCSFAGASLILARAVGLIPKQQLLLLDNKRPPLRYDVLSIDTGMKPLKPEALLRAPAQQPICNGHKAARRRTMRDDSQGSSRDALRDGHQLSSPPQQQEELAPVVGDDPAGSPPRLFPCGCPSSGSSSSSRVCCCCCCPKRPLQGIVARWLMLRQQLQRAWEKCLLEGEQETSSAPAAKHSSSSSGMNGSSSSSSMNGNNSSSVDGSGSSSSKPLAAAAAFTSSAFRILVIGGGAQAVQQLLQSFEERQQQQQKQQQQKQQQLQKAGEAAEESQTETAGTPARDGVPLKAEIVLITRFEEEEGFLRWLANVCSSSSTSLSVEGRLLQGLLRRLLNTRGVEVLVNRRVHHLEETGDGRWRAVGCEGQVLVEAFDASFCCTSAGPQDWIKSTGLPLDGDGYLKVLPTLQCEGYPSIFAAGDTASIQGHSRPKTGVYAVRAAPVIEANIIHFLRGEPLEAWRPQASLMSLIVTGRREAVVSRGPFVLHGSWVSRLKKTIDSSWLSQMREFPGSCEGSTPGANSAEAPSSSSFLGLRELGAAAASGAEALSSWVSASLTSGDRIPITPCTEALPHPCMDLFVALLRKVATQGRGCCKRSAGCSGKIPQRILSAALQQLRSYNAQLQQLHNQEEQLQQLVLQQQPLLLQHQPEEREQQWEEDKPLFTRPEVICGLRSPDDSCLFSPVPLRDTPEPQPLMVQSLDFFRFFTGDLFTMGRIAAAHALSDLYACGAEPLTALALTAVQQAPPDLQSNDLLQILCGASTVLAAEGCELSGGHSAVSEGTAAGGLAVTGRILYTASPPPAAAAGQGEGFEAKDGQQQQQQQQQHSGPELPLRKGSAKVCAESLLILTKGLGTGVIFAGNAKARAKGGWVETALQQMQQTNRAAMHVFLQHGASACTDVTGFGLAGHLLEMLDASNKALAKAALGRGGDDPAGSCGVGARIWLDRIPLLPGACELTAQGITASLFTENAAASARRLCVSSAAEAVAAAPLPSLHQEGYNARGLSPLEQQQDGEDKDLLQLLQQQLHGPCCCRLPANAAATEVAPLQREETDTTHTRSTISMNFRKSSSNSSGSSNSSSGSSSGKSCSSMYGSRSCCCVSTCSNASVVFPLLFDPQSSGGLLAVVPAAAAAACLSALRLHVPAMAIGDIVSLPAAAAATAAGAPAAVACTGCLTRAKPLCVVAPEPPAAEA
ncbi:hypothetical protein Esti_001741 [Eimeria stiedai]